MLQALCVISNQMTIHFKFSLFTLRAQLQGCHSGSYFETDMYHNSADVAKLAHYPNLHSRVPETIWNINCLFLLSNEHQEMDAKEGIELVPAGFSHVGQSAVRLTHLHMHRSSQAEGSVPYSEAIWSLLGPPDVCTSALPT